MHFLHYQQLAETTAQFAIHKEWGQGRSIFGGLTAALVLTHIEAQVDLSERDLRTVNIHFCGATQADLPCQLRHRVLSYGKSVIQVEGQLLQNGEVKTAIVACFTLPRRSSISIDLPAKQFPLSIEQAPKLVFEKGKLPDFVQYFDLRYTNNNIPFSGSKDSLISGWMRFANPTEPLDNSGIIALIDAWPPAILPMLTKRAPSSTITWNMEFMYPRPALTVADLLYYQCNAIEADQGYAHTEGKIYHPSGRLLALTRQMIGVYDKVD